MLGTHNSYTHLPATSSFMNRFTFVWRCQDKTVAEQYKAGVRYFDVRVKRDVVRGRKVWRPAHGNAMFNKVFPSLQSICMFFTNSCRGSMFRLLLEDAKDREDFITEVTPLIHNEVYNKVMVFVCIKSGWEVLYTYDKHPKMTDYCYVPWHSGWGFWENVKNFKPSTIKKWANEHNPVITQDMINDPNMVYFMDYA